MSLRLRLALLFALVVAVGIGIASAAAYFTTERALREEIDDFLIVRADEINYMDPAGLTYAGLVAGISELEGVPEAARAASS